MNPEVTFYIELQAMCARYGFLACPLTREQSDSAYAAGLKLDDAYAIACDVNAGFPFTLPEGR